MGSSKVTKFKEWLQEFLLTNWCTSHWIGLSGTWFVSSGIGHTILAARRLLQSSMPTRGNLSSPIKRMQFFRTELRAWVLNIKVREITRARWLNLVTILWWALQTGNSEVKWNRLGLPVNSIGWWPSNISHHPCTVISHRQHMGKCHSMDREKCHNMDKQKYLNTHKFHLMMFNNNHLITTTFQLQQHKETSIKTFVSIPKWTSGVSWRDWKTLKTKRKRKWKRIKWRWSSKMCLICFSNRNWKWIREKKIK